MGRKLVGNSGNDRIYTLDSLAESIVKYLNPVGKCFDPCAGKNAFVKAFKLNGNKTKWCEIDKDKDFFDCSYTSSEWIITNPPFSMIKKFLVHSMNLEVPNIAFLCTINAFWMNGKLDLIHRKGYAIKEIIIVESPYFRKLNNWPQSGFSLGVTVMRKKKYRYPIKKELKITYLDW